jgi:beta-glucosidase-like glycosyl hydrolase
MLLVGGSVFEVPAFVNWAQKVAKFPMLMTADYAKGPGAQVQGATAFPEAKSAEAAHTRGRLIGLEALALGVRMVLWPQGPHLKSELDGLHFSKAAVCIREFPGPDEAVAAEVEGLLLSNRIVAELDDENPVALSRAAVLGTLRREFRFEGLAVTTAVSELGVGPERPVNSGADILLAPSDPVGEIDRLEEAVKGSRIPEATVDRAVIRILLRKERHGLFAERLTDVVRVEQIVGSAAHREAAKRMEA